MSRGKNFSKREKLAQATELFMQRGYSATSMQDIREHLGLNPGSIYATFGNKKQLFIQALNYYHTENLRVLEKLDALISPRQAVLKYFSYSINDAIHNRGQSGCFFVNSSIEMAPHDEEIRRVVERGIQTIRDFYQRKIQRGQIIGEINPTTDAAEAAESLVVLQSGLRIIANLSFSNHQMQWLRNQAERIVS